MTRPAGHSPFPANSPLPANSPADDGTVAADHGDNAPAD